MRSASSNRHEDPRRLGNWSRSCPTTRSLNEISPFAPVGGEFVLLRHHLSGQYNGPKRGGANHQQYEAPCCQGGGEPENHRAIQLLSVGSHFYRTTTLPGESLAGFKIHKPSNKRKYLSKNDKRLLTNINFCAILISSKHRRFCYGSKKRFRYPF